MCVEGDLKGILKKNYKLGRVGRGRRCVNLRWLDKYVCVLLFFFFGGGGLMRLPKKQKMVGMEKNAPQCIDVERVNAGTSF